MGEADSNMRNITYALIVLRQHLGQPAFGIAEQDLQASWLQNLSRRTTDRSSALCPGIATYPFDAGVGVIFQRRSATMLFIHPCKSNRSAMVYPGLGQSSAV
jgi:hypothetical protein